MRTVANLEQVQLEMEKEAQGAGIRRYRESLLKSEVDTPPGLRLLRQAIEPMVGAIEGYLAKVLSGRPGRDVGVGQFLSQFEPEVAAYITAKVALNSLSNRFKVQMTALKVSSLLEDALNHEELAKAEPRLYEQYLRKVRHTTDVRRRHIVLRVQQKFAKVTSIKWTSSEKVKLGTILLTLMAESTGLIQLVRTAEPGGKTPIYVEATPDTVRWLEESHARCELLSPIYMPMVVPPRPWTTPLDGGYMSQDLRLKLLKVRNWNYLEELRNWDMPNVYSAVNALQATAWKINAPVFRVMREIWESGGSLGKLPPRDNLPRPAQPFADGCGTEEQIKDYKRLLAQTYEDNIRLTSKRFGMYQKMEIAARLGEFEAIYFPHVLDWRGRAYPVSAMVNPQADDSGKALLTFAEGKPLGDNGPYWLAVHGANAYGVDKVSFESRVAWVEENHDKILDCALNPIDGTRFWADADAPYQFLAFCFEWLGYSMQGAEYVSHLPVSWDGSCNGLQNFSAMLRDPVGGAATNLVPSDKPADIYAQVAAVAQRMVDEQAAKGDAQAALWANGKVTRRLAKRNTMTLPYGATRHGFKEQLMAELRKISEESDGVSYLGEGSHVSPWAACGYLADIMYDAVGEVVVAARQAMDWLVDAARVAAKGGLPVYWVSPSGLLVVQDYRKQQATRMDHMICGQRVQLVIRADTDKLDSRKQAQGIAPNFVHSMDAAHMMATVNACSEAGVLSLAMVHDSFGTHAADAEELAYLLRATFVEQYRGDVLQEFRNNLLEQLPPDLAAKIPPLPAAGTLDLSAIVDSQYFFA